MFVTDDHEAGMELVKIAGVIILGSAMECNRTVIGDWVMFTGNQDGTAGGGAEWTCWWGDGGIRHWGGLHGEFEEEKSHRFFRG